MGPELLVLLRGDEEKINSVGFIIGTRCVPKTRDDSLQTHADRVDQRGQTGLPSRAKAATAKISSHASLGILARVMVEIIGVNHWGQLLNSLLDNKKSGTSTSSVYLWKADWGCHLELPLAALKTAWKA